MLVSAGPVIGAVVQILKFDDPPPETMGCVGGCLSDLSLQYINRDWKAETQGAVLIWHEVLEVIYPNSCVAVSEDSNMWGGGVWFRLTLCGFGVHY